MSDTVWPADSNEESPPRQGDKNALVEAEEPRPSIAGQIGDCVSKSRSRYGEVLLRIKLHFFETVSTIVVLALFTQFALRELRPVIMSIRSLFHAP